MLNIYNILFLNDFISINKLFTGLVLAVFFATCANAADFAERCGQLTRQADITAVFQDRPATTDESKTVQALTVLSGKPTGGPNRILGLTHAKPSFQMAVVVRVISDAQGQTCAMPDIALTLSFADFIVYLAQDLSDPCRREVIRAHEQEHVSTWQSHLRASAQMLPLVLRRELGDARIYVSRDEADTAVRAWTTELISPWLKRITDAALEAQQAIDTPMSYANVVGRLRACPSPARGGRN